uniref:MBD domain-containing protein n=1 Tax=Lotus japonicus TaxID=34305 RepID=I3SW30_LOTJA|nr:unknown [Lotus japonicus]
MADTDGVQKEQLNQNPSGNEFQIVRFMPFPNFKLPDDWVVETKPRPSKPTHIDKYYYEPGTGKKFRSLLAVQRHLAGEPKHYVTPERMISENEDNYYYEPSTGKKYRSLLAVKRHLTEETKHYVTPERMISENKDTASSSLLFCLYRLHKYASLIK